MLVPVSISEIVCTSVVHDSIYQTPIRSSSKIAAISHSNTVNMAALASSSPVVEVYSTPGCKYCRIAKAKLTQLGINYVNIDIQDVNIVNVMSQRDTVNTERVTQRVLHAKQSTVPQLYVDDEYIGGCTELLAETESSIDGVSILYERLQRKGIKWGQQPSSLIADQNNDSTLTLANTGHKGAVDYTPATGEPLNSLRFAHSAQQTSAAHLSAVGLAKQLQQRALALTDAFTTIDGKRVQYAAMLTSPEFAEYVSQSCRLQQCNLTELAALTHAEKIAFYANLYNALIIHANCVLRTEETVAGREPVSKASLTSPEAIAQRSQFFSGATGAEYRIGGCNHTMPRCDADQCETAPPDDLVNGGGECASIDVTPDLIEHAILRANRPHPSQVSAALAQDTHSNNPHGATEASHDAKYYYQHLSYVPAEHPIVVNQLPIARDRFDPRIHFILNCGAVSCPPIKVLDSAPQLPKSAAQSQSGAAATLEDSVQEAGGNVEQALCAAAAAYLHSEVTVDLVQKHVYLPRLLLWYEKDFGSDLHAVLARTAELMSDRSEMKGILQMLLSRPVVATGESVMFTKPVVFVAEGSEEEEFLHDATCDVFVVKYNAYDWTLNSV